MKAIALLVLGALPRVIVAQDAYSESHARWGDPWSPLAPRADHASSLPNARVGPVYFDSLRYGLFWTVGNPAALRSDISNARADYSFAVNRESGALRRPLDPSSTSSYRAEAIGWSVVSERLALLGRAALQRMTATSSAPNVLRPYSSSPFVTLDTSASDVDGTRAAVEGVAAVAVGCWSGGLSAGYDGAIQQSVEAGLVRTVRQSTTGLSMGMQRSFRGIVVAPYVRWRGRAETTSLFERDAEGTVLELETLTGGRFLSVLQAYFRRSSEQVVSGGWSMSSSPGARSWFAYGERSGLRLSLTSQATNDPAVDTWKANEWSGGIGYRVTLDSTLQAVFLIRSASLTGSADLARDSLRNIGSSRETSHAASIDLRRTAAGSPWSHSLTTEITFERRDRLDRAVPIAASLTGLTVAMELQVSKRFRRAVMHGLIATGRYSASGSFPDPNEFGTDYRRYVVGQYDLMGRPMTPFSFGVGARWRARDNSWLWSRVAWDRVSAERGATVFGAIGSRQVASATIGVTAQTGR